MNELLPLSQNRAVTQVYARAALPTYGLAALTGGTLLVALAILEAAAPAELGGRALRFVAALAAWTFLLPLFRRWYLRDGEVRAADNPRAARSLITISVVALLILAGALVWGIIFSYGADRLWNISAALRSMAATNTLPPLLGMLTLVPLVGATWVSHHVTRDLTYAIFIFGEVCLLMYGLRWPDGSLNWPALVGTGALLVFLLYTGWTQHQTFLHAQRALRRR